jgi:hypothetical protein
MWGVLTAEFGGERRLAGGQEIRKYAKSNGAWAAARPHAIVTAMDRKSRFPIRRYASLEAMKADEYGYWQQQPAHARMDAVTEITAEAYGLKDSPPDARRLQRTIVHIKR